ncbi:Short-chain dehydrogenase/reductase family protein [Mycena venus]|uniref:Short-chain dehydrogenase/reductase family protein n=1 Tax=Mycena venus TaxID=2733690 RepID=A0A8H7CEW3_9AGAR|nr:Short-chain dehydrogenase/reductase family protein [Mycena venus]
MFLPTFSVSSTAEEVATTLAAEIKGKNVLITGTSRNGIGFETARVIAKYANLVIITGYNLERLKLSEAIKQEFSSANIRPLVLDLLSLSSVRKTAAEVNTYSGPLHVLIHNAATPIGPFKPTEDKIESQVATNHVAPFLPTKPLVPKLLATLSSAYIPRVVFVSSAAHAAHAGVFESSLLHPEPATYYTGSGAYFLSKSANVPTAIELSKRSGGRINAYSLHPGGVSSSLIRGHKYGSEGAIYRGYAGYECILDPDGNPNTEKFPWKVIPEAAATIVVAAFDPRLDGVPGGLSYGLYRVEQGQGSA